MADFQEIKRRIAAGDASGALSAAKSAVRESPSDPSLRSALFSLFAVHGEWTRAADQLDTARTLGADISLAVYEVILKTVSDREKVIRGETAPHFPGGQPPDWYPDWQSALAELASGNPELLESVILVRSPQLDQINGFNSEFEFEGFRNCDNRIAGSFEGVFEGRYSWIPFERVLRISVPERPELLQDLVWLPVMIHLKSGEALKGYLYSTYPGTPENGADDERLARISNWDDRFDSIDIARGVQLFALGSEIVPVFSLGTCSLNTPAPSTSDS